MVTQEQIRQNLKEAIEGSQLTQKEIADKVGIKPTQISAYKKGRKMPTVETFANICIAMDISADEIMGIKIF